MDECCDRGMRSLTTKSEHNLGFQCEDFGLNAAIISIEAVLTPDTCACYERSWRTYHYVVDQPRTSSIESITMSSSPSLLVDDSVSGASSASLDLTPLRAHYLKRELVTLQLRSEMSHLDSPEALALLGPPFFPQTRFINGQPQPAPAAGSREDEMEREEVGKAADLPFLRFVFNRFVLSFPFLANCPPTFFSHKLQPLVYSFISRNISSDDQEDQNQRRKMSAKVEKKMGLILSAAVKLSENGGREEIVRIAADGSMVPAIPASQQSVFNLDTSGLPRSGVRDGLLQEKEVVEDDFVVNIVAVRNAVVRGRVRNKSHEEFIVRTRRSGVEEVYVTRRYGDFTKLTETVRCLSIFPTSLLFFHLRDED